MRISKKFAISLPDPSFKRNLDEKRFTFKCKSQLKKYNIKIVLTIIPFLTSEELEVLLTWSPRLHT